MKRFCPCGVPFAALLLLTLCAGGACPAPTEPAGPVITCATAVQNGDSTLTITGHVDARDPVAYTITFTGPDWLEKAGGCDVDADGNFSKVVPVPKLDGPTSLTCAARAVIGNGAASEPFSFVVELAAIEKRKGKELNAADMVAHGWPDATATREIVKRIVFCANCRLIAH